VHRYRIMPEPVGTFSGFEVESLGTLTSAGAGSAVQCGGVSMTFQITVSNIGTNVVIRFEGSLDGSSYFNLDSANADTTITANGTYGYALSGCPVKYIRLRLVSLSGGTPSVAGLVGAA
jgi:hypothetical protein